MTKIDERVAIAINAASFAAANLVYDFARDYTDRADYLPMEALARRVQKTVLKRFLEVLKEET